MTPPPKKKRKPARRSRESYLSRNPQKRLNQLGNLPVGKGIGGDGGLQRNYQHGGYAAISAAELDQKTAQIVEALGTDLPITGPQYDVALRLLAEKLVVRARIQDSLIRHGIERADGSPRPVVEYGLRVDSQIIALLEQFGATPASAAKLGIDILKGQSAQAEFEQFLRREHDDGVVDG